MHLPSKRLMFTSACVVGAALITSGTKSPFTAFAQAPAAAKPQMSEQAFKNIQVLKGIPVDEFMGTMGLFSAALSVCCGDCHVGAGGDNPDWAADPPRKKIARQMVTMVNNINKTNFSGTQRITCWTCHRGVSEPAATPSIDTIYSEPVVPPADVLKTATSGVPTVDQIFDKFFQSMGGAANLAKLTSWSAKGTAISFGTANKADKAELYAKAPAEYATIINQDGGAMERVTDGRNAWVQLPLTVVKLYPLNDSALEGGKLDGKIAFPQNIKSFFPTWHVSFPTTLDVSETDSEGRVIKAEQRDVYVVQGTGNPQGMFATFYFDKQNGHLLRMVRYAKSAMGRVPTQIDWSDFRPVGGGVTMAHKFVYGWVSGREGYTLTEITPNAQVPDSRFARPTLSAK